MNRRSFVRMAAASSLGLAAGIGHGGISAEDVTQITDSADEENLKIRWQKLDSAIRGWWDGDLHSATEKEVRADQNDSRKPLIFQPFPYMTPGGSLAAFPEMYGWDTQFINMGLIEHDRLDIVRWNILDQLFQIERFGVVLGASREWCIPRGQPPLLAWSIEKYLSVRKNDDELAMLAYPLLERSYIHYWNGKDHSTPIGLTTCNTPNCTDWPLEWSGVGEAGLDFTPIFDGKITECVPIHMNCCLVKQAQVLALLADRFGWSDKAARWRKEADTRAQLINKYCWDEGKGCYMEYNYVQKRRLPYYSLNTFWPLWTGVASKAQAQSVVDHLELFDRNFGLTFTDKTYPNPYPQFKNLEWAYPEAWPNQQMIVALALQHYGFHNQAKKINRRYLANVVTTWEKTGLTWERYNAVVGGHVVPLERHEPRPLHGWTSASVVTIGRMLFS